MMNSKFTPNDELYTTRKIWESVTHSYLRIRLFGSVSTQTTQNQKPTYGVSVTRSYGRIVISLQMTMAIYW